MDHPDPKIISFIIRTRMENQGIHRRNWYGWIVQPPSDERAYFRDLLECFDMIAAELNQAGADVGWLWKVRHFLHLDSAVRSHAVREIANINRFEKNHSEDDS